MGVHETHSLVLLVVGDASEPVRRVPVSWWALMAVGLGLIGFFTLVGSVLYHHLSLVDRVSENHSLRQENRAMKSELVLVEERIADIQETIHRIKHYDTELREAATPHAPEPTLAVGPIELGGAVSPTGSPVAQEKMANLPDRLLSLSAAATLEEQSLRELQVYFDDRETLLASTPSMWPTRGWITSDFGGRADPVTGGRRRHEGIDIASTFGQPIYAPSDGTVVFAGREGNYGNVLVIDHGFRVKTRYGHLSKIHVHLGSKVKRGAQIAAMGSSGRSTGPHLHYEVRIGGIPENPRKFVLE